MDRPGQIFHPRTNTIARASLVVGAVLTTFLLWFWAEFIRSPYTTEQWVVRDQPVPFSHEHHVSGLGIDCKYCHTSVEKSSFAGLPSTEICMHCHQQIWKDSPMLEPVRESYRTGEPLRWTRVHDLPDFVYFNHSIHIAKGVDCSNCHGEVADMPLMKKAHSLQMDWCLDCHRHPPPFARGDDESQEFASTMAPRPPNADRGIQTGVTPQLTNCWVCHR